MKTRKNAFTLIELLVVIAIISLLVSILMPSLSTARELARGVLCLSNQRGLGVTALMFADENQQKFCVPDGVVHINPNIWDESWIRFMCNEDASSVGTERSKSSAGIITCPSDKNQPESGHIQRSYAINPCIINYAGLYQTISAAYSSVKTGDIPLATETVLLSEFHAPGNTYAENCYFTMDYFPLPGQPAYYGITEPFHRDGGNLLFADGRAQWIDALSDITAYYHYFNLNK